MSSAGDNLFAKKVTATEVKATDVNSTNVNATKVECTDLESTGTIKWQTFVPAITADGGIPTLAAVLQVDGDANNQDIINVRALTMHEDDGTTIMNPPDGHMTGVQLLDANAVTCTTATILINNVGSNLTFDPNAGGTVIEGSTLANNKTVCTNLDLTSATNLFPSSIDDDTLNDVLTRGNDAGGLNITNVALLDSANAQVGTVSTPGRLSVVGSINAHSATTPYINLNWAPGSDPANPNPNAKLDFTGIGGEGQKTEIEGDDTETAVGSGIPQRTKCSYLDLTDSTNLHPPPTEERYEWYAVWEDPKTYFPPPPYPEDPTAAQIPTASAVCFDFDQKDEDWNWGWRYFAPMKAGGNQSEVIDPGDLLGASAGDYIWGQNNRDNTAGMGPWQNVPNGITNTAWNYAFHGVTAPTTIASHSSQIVELTITSYREGYGRFYMALAISVQDAQGVWQTPVVMEETFRLVKEHEGNAFASNPRIQGPFTMKWWIKGGATIYPNIPTDGSTCRLYPVVRTDDKEGNNLGRLQVTIGNAQPLNGSDGPEFLPDNTNAKNSQIFLRGYPLPPTFTKDFNFIPDA